MARDLPYFKFIISEWSDGDITLCGLEAQGLFINLCALYWSQECELSLTKAKRRYNDCNTTVWDELINEGVIKIQEDRLIINFLTEQFEERKVVANQNRKNVNKRWKSKPKNTTVLPSYNGGNVPVYNKEEKREEEIRKEEVLPTQILKGDEIWWEQAVMLKFSDVQPEKMVQQWEGWYVNKFDWQKKTVQEMRLSFLTWLRDPHTDKKKSTLSSKLH